MEASQSWPLNKDEPKPTACVPDCPEVLAGESRKEWDRMSVLLHQHGLLTNLDRAALAAYCLAWGRMVDAETKLREHGSVIISGRNVPMQSPYLRIAVKAQEQLVRILVEFGLSPSSRTRVAAQPTAANESDRERRRRKFFGA